MWSFNSSQVTNLCPDDNMSVSRGKQRTEGIATAHGPDWLKTCPGVQQLEIHVHDMWLQNSQKSNNVVSVPKILLFLQSEMSPSFEIQSELQIHK